MPGFSVFNRILRCLRNIRDAVLWRARVLFLGILVQFLEIRYGFLGSLIEWDLDYTRWSSANGCSSGANGRWSGANGRWVRRRRDRRRRLRRSFCRLF